MSSLIGQTIGHYRIREHLGGGGMGVIYRAEDIRLRRTGAMAFLLPSPSAEPEAKERFLHEAQAASALERLHICIVYEINETDDGQPFIAMACYGGETLGVDDGAAGTGAPDSKCRRISSSCC